MQDEVLDRLARECGLGDAYRNYRGELTPIGAATRKAILGAMGWPTDDAVEVERMQRERVAANWGALLPRVVVVHPGSTTVRISADEEDLHRSIEWRIACEAGGELHGQARIGDLAELERAEIDGGRRSRRALVLPDDVPHGYHTLRVDVANGAGAECALISAPRHCYEPRALRDGNRLWGVAVQLYTLRSHGNWGIGDFADLEDVVRGFAAQGASFIALNPLHALFPANPWHYSPYSSSSRHFLNVLYIAVAKVPEFAECAEARLCSSDALFAAELERLRSTPLVDYAGVSAAKLPLLRMLYEHFCREHLAGGTPRAAAFTNYAKERGEPLRLHALHDAIDEHLRALDAGRYWGWPVWPEDLREPHRPGVREFEQSHAAAVGFHEWLQWIAEEQLVAAQRLARSLGMAIGLYGDYAVGVNPSGSETWSDQALYRRGAGVGAPPDALALKGQDWGIPPQDPNVLAAQAYQPFRNLIAANMRHPGALRLDHIMALYRQWWVPVGLGARDGGYVHYPLDDLMSVLALESERHACLVIGEDLGTVPPEVSHAMSERAVYSYRVLLFEKHADGSFRRPDEYPRRAIATVTTHDLPTLASYWAGNDIELRRRLALYPAEDIRLRVERERDADRHALLAALEAAGLRPFDDNESPALRSEARSIAIHSFLASSAAGLVALQIEDLVGMMDPVNVPGTSDEHANWQRKMNSGVEDVISDEHVRSLLAAVREARGP